MDRETYIRILIDALQAKKREIQEAENILINEYNAMVQQVREEQQNKNENTIETETKKVKPATSKE